MSKACLSTEHQHGSLELVKQPMGGQHHPQLSQSPASPLGNLKLPQKGSPLAGWFGYFGGSAQSQEQLCFFFGWKKSHFYAEDTGHLPCVSGHSPHSHSSSARALQHMLSLNLHIKVMMHVLGLADTCFMWLKPKALFIFLCPRLQAVLNNWRQVKGHKLPCFTLPPFHPYL